MVSLAIAVALLGSALSRPSAAHHPEVPIVGTLLNLTLSQEQDQLGSGSGSGGTTGSAGSYASRATTDKPDAKSGKQTHLIYFVPSDRPDEKLDTNGRIARSFDSIRAWFRAKSGGLRPRADLRRVTGKSGKATVHDVTFVRGNRDAAEYGTDPTSSALADLKTELRQKGFNKANKRYLIYAALDQDNVCGQGFWPHDEPGGTPQTNYAVLYLDSDAGCGARDFGDGTVSGAGRAEAVALQEWIHTEGLVYPVSPAALTCTIDYVPLPAHVCTGALALLPGLDPEETDVMFPFATDLTLAQKALDRGSPDYFDHDREAELGTLCGILDDVGAVDDGTCYDLKASLWLERA